MAPAPPPMAAPTGIERPMGGERKERQGNHDFKPRPGPKIQQQDAAGRMCINNEVAFSQA
eukprot:15446826-Alexandrium_andersonii.AAC.1